MKYTNMTKRAIRSASTKSLRIDKRQYLLLKNHEWHYRRHARLMNELLVIDTELKRRGELYLGGDLV